MTTATNTTTSAAQTQLSSAVSKTAQAQQQFSANMNTFLQLLTTQLKYQDPLSPMDTAQFTNQLVEFASVQQQIDINQNLEKMLSNQDNSAMATAANYIGQQATALSSSVPLQGGAASFSYTVPADTKSVNVVFSDASGNIVGVTAGNPAAGTNTSTWNGQSILTGKQLPDGTYTVSVQATSNTGQNTQLGTAVTGKVTGVGMDPATNQTELFMGGVGIDLSNVIEVQAAGSSLDNGQIGDAINKAATSSDNTNG